MCGHTYVSPPPILHPIISTSLDETPPLNHPHPFRCADLPSHKPEGLPSHKPTSLVMRIECSGPSPLTSISTSGQRQRTLTLCIPVPLNPSQRGSSRASSKSHSPPPPPTDGLKRPSIRAAFAILDRNGDGFITRDELASSLGIEYSIKEIDDMMVRAGNAKKMHITFDDFKSMMLQDLESQGIKSLNRLDQAARDKWSGRSSTSAQ